MTNYSERSVVTVGLVDDLQMFVDGLTTELSAPEYKFEVTISAVGWEQLLNHPNFPPQVVVLDLNLGDGIDIETKIRALRTANTEVVIVSRHTHAGTISRALRAGATGYVPKSSAASTLATAIRNASIGLKTVPNELLGSPERHTHGDLPRLGMQEQRALTLYAAGKSMREVAAIMQTTEETVKSYVKRARKKYRKAGIDIGTKLLLRAQGEREGWLPAD